MRNFFVRVCLSRAGILTALVLQVALAITCAFLLVKSGVMPLTLGPRTPLPPPPLLFCLAWWFLMGVGGAMITGDSYETDMLIALRAYRERGEKQALHDFIAQRLSSFLFPLTPVLLILWYLPRWIKDSTTLDPELEEHLRSPAKSGEAKGGISEVSQ